ncbi:Protein kinase domain [Dillenia turbinata]|uniref:mitogen-activated protein kinase kinase kinase n=1 Tax=Dillenia turbinata TaxID=194707 RepID=A0AAN8VY22_9MAGN
MDPKNKKRKPKLERRNAVKNIDYNAGPPNGYESSTSSSAESSLRTRSLDLPPYSHNTSFRVEGNDGEFELYWKSLGLSGPEGFAISTAEWESRKIRSSSDLLPRSRLYSDESPKVKSSEIEETVAELARFSETNGEVKELVIEESVVSELASRVPETVTVSEKPLNNGIKGIRPPVLSPPPSIMLGVMDNAGSTWDIIKSLAPDCDRGSSLIHYGFTSSEEEEEEEEERRGNKREVVGGGRIGETAAVLSDSCSFTTTSNDDDSSSTTTEPTSNVSPNGRFRPNISYWQKGELLGRGTFGTVYEGIAEDGFFFAVKEVSLLDQGSQAKQSISQLEQEIALLSQFEHENIVQYLGTDKDESKLYIFLELVTKGSLASLYQRYYLRDSQVSAYTRQILCGLKYLHDRNVVHRDIKCANILVDASGSVKLSDFGLAKATTLNDVKSCKGTACWMAPEVINLKNQGYGLAADIWSLGCTVLEMLTRRIPYSDLEWMQAAYKIGKGIPPSVPDTLSREAKDFIMQCLKVNPDERPTAAQLLDHPFVKRPPLSISGMASPLRRF